MKLHNYIQVYVHVNSVRNVHVVRKAVCTIQYSHVHTLYKYVHLVNSVAEAETVRQC